MYKYLVLRNKSHYNRQKVLTLNCVFFSVQVCVLLPFNVQMLISTSCTNIKCFVCAVIVTYISFVSMQRFFNCLIWNGQKSSSFQVQPDTFSDLKKREALQDSQSVQRVLGSGFTEFKFLLNGDQSTLVPVSKN